jgi:hypothetical protein
MSRARLIDAAETLARTMRLDEDQQIAALKQAGFGEGEAHRLVALLPMAFSRPILEELGVSHFDKQVRAKAADGTLVEAALMRQPEYVAGLKLARDHLKSGVLARETYKIIAESSAEIDAASNALNGGADITGATISTMLVGTTVAQHLIR